jgi:ankyrin repeat protein
MMAALSEEVYRLSNSDAGNSVELEALLKAHPGVDVNLHKSDSGEGCLRAAAGRNNAASTRLLINASADLEARDKYGYTPLALACDKGNLDCVQVLIENKADARIATIDINQLAHEFARKGNSKCLRLLIDANADPKARDKHGHTPLHWASQSGNLDCVQVLIESKADVQTADNGGLTPAHKCAHWGHSKCLRLLIDANADPGARCGYGQTPLTLASREGNLDCVQVLIENKAGLNRQLMTMTRLQLTEQRSRDISSASSCSLMLTPT